MKFLPSAFSQSLFFPSLARSLARLAWCSQAAASVDAAKAAGWTKHDGKVEGHSAVWLTHSLDAGTSEATLKAIFPMPDGFALPAVGEHACHADRTQLNIALAHYHFPSVEVTLAE